jgi:hypothetical protein
MHTIHKYSNKYMYVFLCFQYVCVCVYLCKSVNVCIGIYIDTIFNTHTYDAKVERQGVRHSVPHTSIYLPSYCCYISVAPHVLLYMCPHTVAIYVVRRASGKAYVILYRILLYMCPHTVAIYVVLTQGERQGVRHSTPWLSDRGAWC